MNARRPAVLALALVAAVGSSAGAATTKAKPLPKPKPLVITDKAGDANGLNSQSHAAPADPSQAGPGERTAADILSVSLGRLDNGKAVTGLTASFTLGAAPDQGTIYRIQGATADCSTFWISYNFPLGGTPSAALRENCSGTAVSTVLSGVVVKDATITISLPFKDMPKSIKVGTEITGVFGETKGHATTPAASPTVPTIDDTETAATSYKVGS
jgi:hypothetical protein